MENYFKKAFIIKDNSTVYQFIRYVVTGGTASLADISIFSIGANTLDINHIQSNSMGFVVGLTVNYLLSRGWVFNKSNHKVIRDFFLFSLIGIIGLILSNIFMYIMVDTGLLYAILASSNDELVKVLAKLLVTFLVLLWNFAARRRLVFGIEFNKE
ncbi:MAG: GtrA family protein [Acetivibrionales bacterium]